MKESAVSDALLTSVDSLCAYLLGTLTVALGVYSSWVRVDPFYDGPVDLVYISGMDSGFDIFPAHILYWSALAVGALAVLETGAAIRGLVEEHRLTPPLGAALGLASLALIFTVAGEYAPFTSSTFEFDGGAYLLITGGVLLLWASGVHYLSD